MNTGSIARGLQFLEANPHEIAYRSGDLTIRRTTDSTMNDIDRLIAAQAPHGATVIALEQTQGRGSVDPITGTVRKWWSKLGNLMFSRIVQTKGHPSEIEFIGALAVAEIIADLLPRANVSLKFPNDVLVNGEKICGCLVPPQYEVAYSENKAQKVNLGIGVNLKVTPPVSSLRDGSGVRGTSLFDHGVDITIADFFLLFEKRFEALLQTNNAKGFASLLQRMGFADQTGVVTLYAKTDGSVIRGTYVGFGVLEQDRDKLISCLSLKTAFDVKLLPYMNWSAISAIKGSSSLTQSVPVLLAHPHV